MKYQRTLIHCNLERQRYTTWSPEASMGRVSGSGSVYFGRDKREMKQYIRGLAHKQKLKSKRLS